MNNMLIAKGGLSRNRSGIEAAGMRRIVFLICAACLFGVLFFRCTNESARHKPNIVLINVDDLGYADLGCYGNTYVETPQIDALREDGMMFTQAYSAAPVCTPTRASILTGQYPARLQITGQAGYKKDDQTDRALLHPSFRTSFEDTVRTFGSWLQRAGYRTACIGKWGIDGSKPAQFGFDAFFDGKDSVLTRESIEFLSAKSTKPFCLYLNYHYVHVPLEPNAALLEKYMSKGRSSFDPAYAAVVEMLDHEVGKILDYLDSSGLRENTLVIFFSDNGGFLGYSEDRVLTTNRPLREGKASLYEGGIRVPMIVRWPEKVAPGTVSDAVVISNDIFPTFLEIAGLEPQFSDGFNLAPLLTEGKGHPSRALFWHWPHYRRSMAGLTASPSSAIRVGSWKLIRFHINNQSVLYNLADDVGESTDLSGQFPDKKKELLDKLDRWMQEVGAKVGDRNPEYSLKAPLRTGFGTVAGGVLSGMEIRQRSQLRNSFDYTDKWFLTDTVEIKNTEFI